MNKSLSLQAANFLFLLTMLLILTVGSVMQYLSLSLGLIATEVLLILLPTLIFLRLRRVPLKTGLRLNPIRPLTALACVLLGFSVSLFSLFIEAVMMQLTGMPPVPVPEGSTPSGVFPALLYFTGLAISAPICEEIMFRGAIQGAYENRRKVSMAITVTALMFAFYHMRLTGLLALLPVAFILGYVAWRTQSIYATMLVHFGMNATSAAITLVYVLGNGMVLPLVSPWTAAAGLAATAALLWVLRRTTHLPQTTASETEPEPAGLPRPSWLAVYWPLIGAWVLYLIVAGLTLRTSPLLV
ncbi:MAG: CPBP family intramembrane metalloprotease, partial [Chloroflexota bacterium]